MIETNHGEVLLQQDGIANHGLPVPERGCIFATARFLAVPTPTATFGVIH